MFYVGVRYSTQGQLYTHSIEPEMAKASLDHATF